MRKKEKWYKGWWLLLLIGILAVVGIKLYPYLKGLKIMKRIMKVVKA